MDRGRGCHKIKWRDITKDTCYTQVKRDPIITIYEAKANPADHKIPGAEDKMGHSIQ